LWHLHRSATPALAPPVVGDHAARSRAPGGFWLRGHRVGGAGCARACCRGPPQASQPTLQAGSRTLRSDLDNLAVEAEADGLGRTFEGDAVEDRAAAEVGVEVAAGTDGGATVW
jgi:hypothetical protein